MGNCQCLDNIVASYQGQRGALIPILEKAQEELGFLSEETISQIAQRLGTSPNTIYGVASFYALFRFTKPGKHTVRVCQGTACHVRGSHRILEEVEDKLGVKPGETTQDGMFSLERVACVGCCALAPVMIVDSTVHPRMTVAEAKKTLAKVGESQ